MTTPSLLSLSLSLSLPGCQIPINFASFLASLLPLCIFLFPPFLHFPIASNITLLSSSRPSFTVSFIHFPCASFPSFSSFLMLSCFPLPLRLRFVPSSISFPSLFHSLPLFLYVLLLPFFFTFILAFSFHYFSMFLLLSNPPFVSSSIS